MTTQTEKYLLLCGYDEGNPASPGSCGNTDAGILTGRPSDNADDPKLCAGGGGGGRPGTNIPGVGVGGVW